MRLASALLGASLLYRAGFCHAAEPARPADDGGKTSSESAEPSATPKLRFRTSFDLGGSYFGAQSDSQDLNRFGIALESNSVIPVDGRWGVGLRFGWGMTEFQRFDDWANTGYRVGKWTTTAYGDVYEWSAEKGDYQIFRIFGSFFAYIGLFFPLVVAGICYVGAVVAPTTYLETAVVANYDFGNQDLGPFVEAGIGVAGFIHPRYGKLRGAFGPSFGSGLRLGAIRVGAHVTWSPPYLHGEAGPDTSHIVYGGLTLGVISR
jgi:hypothetical protein